MDLVINHGPREYSHHTKGDPLYISAALRQCVGCHVKKPEDCIKPLRYFVANPSHQKDGWYTNLCRECIKETREQQRQHNESIAATSMAETFATIVKRRTQSNAAEVEELLAAACEPMGGVTKAIKLGGKVMHKVLRTAAGRGAKTAQVEAGLKVVAQLFRAAADADKSRRKSFDLSGLTEEEQREILIEPARELLLRDAQFRRELMADPEVRRELLGSAGVETIESVAITSEVENGG